MKRVGILSLLLLSAAVSASSVYKWTDKNGRVHYGDNPVFNAEKVEAKPGTAAAEPPPADGSPEAKRAAECAQQKDQLSVYQNAARLVERDSLGNEKEFSAEDKDRLIAQTQAKIKSLCAQQPAARPAPGKEPEAR